MFIHTEHLIHPHPSLLLSACSPLIMPPIYHTYMLTHKQVHVPHQLLPHTLPPPTHSPVCRVQAAYINASRELKRLDALAFSPIFQHYQESLAGLATLRAFGRAPLFADINRVGGGVSGWCLCFGVGEFKGDESMSWKFRVCQGYKERGRKGCMSMCSGMLVPEASASHTHTHTHKHTHISRFTTLLTQSKRAPPHFHHHRAWLERAIAPGGPFRCVHCCGVIR